MGFTGIFGFIYSIIKAVPVLDKAVRDFFIFYAIKQKEWFANDVTKAVEKAIRTGQTEDLERDVGSPQAGKPSGQDGTTFDDPNNP